MRFFLLVLLLFGIAHTGLGQSFIKKNIRGLEVLSSNNGVAVADYDLDGHLDFYIVATEPDREDLPQTWSRLFKNKNDASFQDVTTDAGLKDSYNYNITLPRLPFSFSGDFRSGASWGDYNNDGYPDLFLTNYKYNKLYKNNGDGTFTNVTSSSGLADLLECYSASSMWVDVDNDADLDLIISSWARCTDSRLFNNNGDGTFTDQSWKIHASANKNTWMTLPLDVNDDHWIDLLMINDFGSNNLLINQGGVFTDKTAEYNLLETDLRTHMGSAFADFNNDGRFEIYVSDIQRNGFWMYDGSRFNNVATALNVGSSEWSWQTKAADLDLDGDQDITVINGYRRSYANYYFRNDLADGVLAFSDQSLSSGFGEDTNSMCFELFDYDHDGDLDAIVANLKSKSIFLENQAADMNPNLHWVKVDLEGTISNRNGIGSRIELTTEDDNVQYIYYTGVGFMTQSLQPVHFGVAGNTQIKKLKITWPLGLVEEYMNLPVNTIIKLKEANGYSLLNYTSNKVPGCIDIHSCNYNPAATVEDGSCSYLESFQISGANKSTKLKRETYTYPGQAGHEFQWRVVNGTILSGQGTNQVEVQWSTAIGGNIKVLEIGPCYGEEVTLGVTLAPEMINAHYSIARMWNEILLEAIRKDFARPTVHARNLFHTSAMMYDIWSMYTKKGTTYLLENEQPLNAVISSKSVDEIDEGIRKAMSYAVSKFLKWRFRASPGYVQLDPLISNLMIQLGYNPSFYSVDYADGNDAAIGNYIAQIYIDYGLTDDAGESYGYGNTYYSPVNTPLAPALPGNPLCEDPNRWQPLKLAQFVDQAGNLINTTTPLFLSPEWGRVKPFGLKNADRVKYNRGGADYFVYHDPGEPPLLNTGPDSQQAFGYQWAFSLVSIWGSHLDPHDGVMIDISPKSKGNIPLEELPTKVADYPHFFDLKNGGDIGKGRQVNPRTNLPYLPNLVPRGDYTRVLAEFWADGPDSETPPGHWFTILNYVNDNPLLVKRYEGQGALLSDLEWDVKAYFTLGGAVHDAAISSWGIKGWYDYIRPISAIRYMAEKGQSTNPALPNYNTQGLPLEEGFIEIVQAGDPLAGVGNEHLGKIKLYTWRGHEYINNPALDEAGVGWILAENWWPYQRPSFVTPPFAGYISGHSTYSRAAAEVLTMFTGDEYFPGGLGEFLARKNEFLVFEEGPSQDIKLQWATYRDASDQCSLSRIWGGIHPPADDIPGRIIGAKVGKDAFSFAKSYFTDQVLGLDMEPTKMNLFPNPSRAGQVVFINNVPSNPKVQIMDLSGRMVQDVKIELESTDPTLRIDTHSLSPGIYLVRINNVTLKLMIVN